MKFILIVRDLCPRKSSFSYETLIKELQAASSHFEALDAVLTAYQTIGKQIPILADLENLPLNDHLKELLGMVYADILEFHAEAVRHFKRNSMSSSARYSYRCRLTPSLQPGIRSSRQHGEVSRAKYSI